MARLCTKTYHEGDTICRHFLHFAVKQGEKHPPIHGEVRRAQMPTTDDRGRPQQGWMAYIGVMAGHGLKGRMPTYHLSRENALHATKAGMRAAYGEWQAAAEVR